jgi:phosphate/sulfate permease
MTAATLVLTPSFLIFFEKSYNSKKQKKSKKYIFDIFALFLAFSMSFQNN